MTARNKRTLWLGTLLIAVFVAVIDLAVVNGILTIASVSVDCIVNIALFFLIAASCFSGLVVCSATNHQ